MEKKSYLIKLGYSFDSQNGPDDIYIEEIKEVETSEKIKDVIDREVEEFNNEYCGNCEIIFIKELDNENKKILNSLGII